MGENIWNVKAFIREAAESPMAADIWCYTLDEANEVAGLLECLGYNVVLYEMQQHMAPPDIQERM